jgi:hypothetical protein
LEAETLEESEAQYLQQYYSSARSPNTSVLVSIPAMPKSEESQNSPRDEKAEVTENVKEDRDERCVMYEAFYGAVWNSIAGPVL